MSRPTTAALITKEEGRAIVERGWKIIERMPEGDARDNAIDAMLAFKSFAGEGVFVEFDEE